MARRVLHLIYSFYHGGAEHLIGTLLSAERDSGFEHSVRVLTSGGQPLDDLREKGINIASLGKKQGPDPFFLRRLIDHLGNEGPDMIDLHNNSAALWGTAAVIAGRLKIPLVRTEHRPWIPEELPFFHRSTYPFFAGKAKRIIAVSEHARQTYVDSFPRLSDRIVTVPNGIDPKRFESPGAKEHCREWFGLPADAFIIGTAGRLVPVKNHRLLLDAFMAARENVPEAHLAILGQGGLEGELRRYAARNGVAEHLSILPASPSVPKFMGALDIFSLTSDSEGLPLTLLEACASGLPVVATSVGGIPEAIEHGVNGLLVDKGDLSALVDAMILLAGSPDIRAGLGTAAARTVAERFTADICAAATYAVYRQALGIG